MSENVRTSVEGNVGLVEVTRGPHNFFDEGSLHDIGLALIALDADEDVRSVVLCAEGKNFCAGADLRGVDRHGLRRVYRAAAAIFTTRKPIVAAIHGAAVGGGLGLALAADFRVAAPGARFTANFARLGFHQGFGISVTLPNVVGHQKALDLLYTGRNVSAKEALQIGLVDRLAASDARAKAIEWATQIAGSGPLAVPSIRSTMRRSISSQVVAALDEEATAQAALLGTADLREGIAASIEKREPQFIGA
ncbi:enoyl-CoA hydratase/isomerase family protein [Diaminobutyricimonas sp. TR449]|uniref:enoyl-CoA hydratase/isomerase family protein n=1 Tax=Diaminobutyricimonas sp. TR449 TaxID=2708076 RepID=UPI0014244F0B|nr:enoyl-CoA hydratase/isomerase family protein [Diaminobutyricimonas sp. TR449]